jgi:uncharacterized membrane protein
VSFAIAQRRYPSANGCTGVVVLAAAGSACACANDEMYGGRQGCPTAQTEGNIMATTGNITHFSSSTVETTATPAVHTLQLSDLMDSLRMGWEDFKAIPTHAIMLVLIYPILGLVLARLTMGYSVLPLLFPMAAGFALLGPFAALGLYELSRRRERGEKPTASQALDVLNSPSFGAMLALGAVLMVLFGVWIACAQAIYVATFGYEPAANVPDFLGRIFSSDQGMTLIVAGCGVGFLFALAALCISAISFPYMLDRHATAPEAMLASLRVVTRNPITMAAWGVIVAALLVLGTIPFFLGLTVVIPVLGHATWHLYRKALEPAAHPYQQPPRQPHAPRYAAEFPSSLFSSWKRDR